MAKHRQQGDQAKTTISVDIQSLAIPTVPAKVADRAGELSFPNLQRLRATGYMAASLAKEATQLRKQAQGTPPGVERDLLVRKARRAETASRMAKWPASGYKHQDEFN
jgi:hypothetical protein